MILEIQKNTIQSQKTRVVVYLNVFFPHKPILLQRSNNLALYLRLLLFRQANRLQKTSAKPNISAMHGDGLQNFQFREKKELTIGDCAWQSKQKWQSCNQ
jgi:hypothetical protein